MEELKIQKMHADFIKPIEVEAEQEFAKKRAIQLENDRKDHELREQQLRKEREQQEQLYVYEQERREQEHMAFLRRQELEKQQKNEPKKPEQDNDNDYTPW